MSVSTTYLPTYSPAASYPEQGQGEYDKYDAYAMWHDRSEAKLKEKEALLREKLSVLTTKAQWESYLDNLPDYTMTVQREKDLVEERVWVDLNLKNGQLEDAVLAPLIEIIKEQGSCEEGKKYVVYA